MTLSPDAWPRLKDVFAGARALPTDDRSAYVAAACVGNEALRQEVESLLSSDERLKSFLEAPAVVRNDDARVTSWTSGHLPVSRVVSGRTVDVLQRGRWGQRAPLAPEVS